MRRRFFAAAKGGNKIYYTSYDGNIIVPSETFYNDEKRVLVLSNTYKDGKGTIVLGGIINTIYDAFDSTDLVSIELPSSVKLIEGTFSDCQYLESVILSPRLETIGDHAFHDCTSLQSVVIPNSVTYIGREAFSQCESLQSVVIPNGVTSIEHSTFYFCTSLQSVVIPNSVISIGELALYSTSLQSVYMESAIPAQIGRTPFDYNTTIFVPKGSLDAYKNAWGATISNIIKEY